MGVATSAKLCASIAGVSFVTAPNSCKTAEFQLLHSNPQAQAKKVFTEA
jgi:hypothetical protein